MKIIERYLHEVGRYLPAKKRVDILSELRSVLEDSLEAAAGPVPTEADAVKVVKEMGDPRKVAAGYHSASQYLIGPELFPLFKMILGFVLLASLGGQLVAVMVSVMFGNNEVSLLTTLAGLLNSLPVSLGTVVIVFYLLQHFEVNPHFKEEEFDPYKLPDIEVEEPVKRAEQVVGIILSVVFFIVLAWVANQGVYGRSWVNGVFRNPVLEQYFFWIGLSIVAGVILSIVLLWRGRWQTSTRIANVVVNLFSLGVLYQLISAHREWLLAAGYSGNFLVVTEIPEMLDEGTQVIGMMTTQFGLIVAAIVIMVETIVFIGRLITRAIRGAPVAVIELPIGK